jgi:hypothetical protein
MFSQQALKALRNSLRNPLRNRLLNPFSLPLCSPFQMRHVHIEQAPYSGPPSYATITQRFSSLPNPLIFFENKRAREAIERGEFTDIHDAEVVEPKDYDVLMTDITDKILRSEIAKLAGVAYLEKAAKDEINKVDIGHGFLYKFRPIFPCVVSFKDRAHWVFFVVDSGAPLTYLSSHVSVATHRTPNR